MNCEHCQLELEDLIYGELPDRRANEVRAHLADCDGCRKLWLELEREHEIFASYDHQTALEPGQEVWAAIRERIRNEGTGPARETGWLQTLRGASSLAAALSGLLRPAILRQAAAAVALIVVTVIVTTMLVSRRDKPGGQLATTATPLPAASEPSPTPFAPKAATEPLSNPRPVVASSIRPKTRSLTDEEMLEQQVARTEREYTNTIKMLDRAIVKRKDTIDPTVYSEYESSLALIDQSIEKSRAALRGRASEVVAGQFLLAAYARKVELMQEIAIQ